MSCPARREVFAGPEFQRLVDALRRAIDGQGRICFSGCGATGRLSILLEACWRQFWQDLQLRHPAVAAKLPAAGTPRREHHDRRRLCPDPVGGELRGPSVFGRRQVQEAGLGPGDVLVAISEGGETSSVIGTIWQSLDNGAEVFFAFNNPAALLAQHIERSRQVIEDPRVTILDLACGPMAVAGSTRMQATTSELLVVGAALELALVELLREKLDAADLARLGIVDAAPADYLALVRRTAAGLGPARSRGGDRGDGPLRRAALSLPGAGDLPGRPVPAGHLHGHDGAIADLHVAAVPQLRRPGLAAAVGFREESAAAHAAGLARGPAPRAALSGVGCRNVPPTGRSGQPPGGPAASGERGHAQVPDRQRGRPLAVRRRRQRRDPGRAGRGGSSDWPCRTIRCARRSTPAPGRSTSGAVLAVGPAAPPRDLAPTLWHVAVRPAASPLRLYDRLAMKLVLNNVSTATMARLGRLVSNWMAHVEPTNKKLIDRGTRLVAELAGVDYPTACYALHETIEELARTLQPRPGKALARGADHRPAATLRLCRGLLTAASPLCRGLPTAARPDRRSPRIAAETCGRPFRRGRETCDRTWPRSPTAHGRPAAERQTGRRTSGFLTASPRCSTGMVRRWLLQRRARRCRRRPAG